MRERAGGVAFVGTLECAYRACLWSRIANRVFLEVAQFEARDAEEFYAAIARIDWTAHLSPTATLACEFSGRHPLITHTHFGALKLKDGIVDALRAATGVRPRRGARAPGLYASTRTRRARTSRSRSTSPVRACTAAVIAALPGKRRSRRTSPRAC